MSPIDYEREREGGLLSPSLFLPSFPLSLDPSFFSQKWSIYILLLSVRPSVRRGGQEEPATDRPRPRPHQMRWCGDRESVGEEEEEGEEKVSRRRRRHERFLGRERRHQKINLVT